MHYNFPQVDDPAIPGPNRLSYGDPLIDELGLKPLGNDIWINYTTVGCGFIIPGTCTYAVFGTIRGIDGGMAYRIRDSEGKQWPGPASYIQEDWTHQVWLFDVNDWLKVKSGEIQPHEMLPYDYHPIDIPLAIPKKEDGGYRTSIFGGAVIGNRVYLTLSGADGYKPIVIAFDAAVDGAVTPPIEPPIVEPPIVIPPVVIPPDTSIADATQAAHDAIDNLVTVLGK